MSIPLPRDLKRSLKNLRRRLSNAYANRFRRFTPEDLAAAIRRVGVQTGDILFVHSSFDSFAGFQGNAMDVIAALQNCVGPQGGLLMPQQPFSGSAIEWAESGRVFDIRRTPTRMGLLPELFRRSRDVSRSLHPTHSVAAWGARGAWAIEAHHTTESPCGPGSPYMRLYEAGGKILHVGSPFSATTFLHAADEILRESMPFDPLTERLYPMKVRDAEGNEREISQRLFDPRYGAVRRPDRLLPGLRRRNRIREERVSGVRILLLETRALVDTMRELAAENVYFYDVEALKR